MDFKELQSTLQKLTNSKISLTQIGDALGIKLSTVSTRVKNGSELKYNEIKKIENYFEVKLTDNKSGAQINCNYLSNYNKYSKSESQGERLKKIRQALNLSQDDFGAIFEISKQFVSLLEKDKTSLNNEKLVKLLLDYNVNINYLLGGIGSMFNPPQFEQVEDDLTQKVENILRKNGLID